jgi:hypothetical protein
MLSLVAQTEGYLSLVLLSPHLAHENQFKSRVSTFNNQTIDEIAELAKVDKLDQLNCISFPFDKLQSCKTISYEGNVRVTNVDYIKLERLASNPGHVNQFLSYVKTKGMVFTIATNERLNLLEQIINYYNPKKVHLILDEADLYFSKTEEKKRKFTLPLSKLYKLSNPVNLFTATPFRLCDDLDPAENDVKVIMLPRSDNHVSTKDYKFNTTSFGNRNRL